MPKRNKAREAAQMTVDDAAATAQPAWQTTNSDGATGGEDVLVRVPPESWKALELIALDQGRTLQDIIADAVDDYLLKRREP